jgi:L-asparaginase
VAARVLLLATKDTIAHGRRGGRPVVASGADLLAALPADRVPADVRAEDVLAEPGWDTSPATMLALARRVRDALADDGFDGVVVTHGTDTMEETAFLADLMAGPAAERGGIVFTGATRRADDLSADGPRNLAAAITAAADPALRGAGAVICADDHLHAARWATQVDAAGAAPFSSAPYAPLGRVVSGRVRPLAAPPPRPPACHGAPETDVALITTYPGIPPELLTAAVDAGARGVVLQGTGAGNVPAGLFTTIGELTEWGVPVVVASRCRTDGVPPRVPGETADGLARDIGAIDARGLPAEKARVALMAALAPGTLDAVRAWFARL